jgi:hypothetical protein
MDLTNKQTITANVGALSRLTTAWAASRLERRFQALGSAVAGALLSMSHKRCKTWIFV